MEGPPDMQATPINSAIGARLSISIDGGPAPFMSTAAWKDTLRCVLDNKCGKGD